MTDTELHRTIVSEIRAKLAIDAASGFDTQETAAAFHQQMVDAGVPEDFATQLIADAIA